MHMVHKSKSMSPIFVVTAASDIDWLSIFCHRYIRQ